MPAMTSALTALRFSGRLMVIQSALPRLSISTLDVSVMNVSSASFYETVKHDRRNWERSGPHGSRHRMKPLLTMREPNSDLIPRRRASAVSRDGRLRTSRRRNRVRVGLPDPDLVVVERGAADGRDRFGAGQHVDALAADMVLVGVDRFRDQHAAPLALEMLRNQCRLAAQIAERDGVAVVDAELGGIVGMDHHVRCALTRLRRRRLVERGIEEAARRAGREAERMRLVRLLD